MIGENGVPVTPEWSTCTGHRCAGCGAGPNACQSVAVLPDIDACCSACSHSSAAIAPPKVVLTWPGDQA